MPALATPSRAPAVAPPAPTTEGPQAAPAPAAEEGTPEWLASWNLSAGNAAALEAIAGVSADDSTASALLDGSAPQGDQQVEEPAQETQAAAPTEGAATEGQAPPPPPVAATPSHAPRGTLNPVYKKHERQTATMDLQLTASQKNELRVFQANWEKNHGRYEAVSAKTGVPAKLIAAIHYREASLRWDTYLHQGDPLGKKAVHHPSNIPIFYKWEDAAVHALNMKKGIKDSMGMDATTTDPEAIATYAEAYNGLGYHNRGKASPYVYGGTDQYTGGRYVADGKYDPRSFDQRLGVMALVGGLDGASEGKAQPEVSEEDAWAAVVEGNDVLRVGSFGAAVTALQKKLGAAGFRCGVDGDFGAGTKKAVMEFQRARKLEADGVVGAGTAAALDGRASAGPGPKEPEAVNPEWARVLAGGLLIRRGDTGEHVSKLQALLTEKGFRCDVDGDFGRGTENAVRGFQKARRLEVDGVVGRGTARALEG
jgi:lysozyme family protein/peptidoglycan hydrolase-like protein with peptidoglycan-binding domain